MSIIVLIGPSGSGKDTIGDELQKFDIPQLVSFTTREMREGEEDGLNYYFVSKKELKTMDIVESTTYSGNEYGLLKTEVEDKLKNNKHVYFISNLDGAKQIKEMYPEETMVFWLKIDTKTMRSRMVLRGDSEDNISERIKFAQDTNETTKPDMDGLRVVDAKAMPGSSARMVLYHVKKEM